MPLPRIVGSVWGSRTAMDWARMLAYVTGTVDQELSTRNEYLAAENRIIKAQLNGRPKLSDAQRASEPVPSARGGGVFCRPPSRLLGARRPMHEAHTARAQRPGQCRMSLVSLSAGKALPWPDGFLRRDRHRAEHPARGKGCRAGQLSGVTAHHSAPWLKGLDESQCCERERRLAR